MIGSNERSLVRMWRTTALEDPVTGRVAVAVIHGLEPVHVDERHDEPSVGPARPIDLMRQRHPAHLAAVGTGQLVEVGRAQLGLEPRAFTGGIGPLDRGTLAVRGRSCALGRGLGTELLQLDEQELLDL